jgi:hypothetical protein
VAGREVAWIGIGRADLQDAYWTSYKFLICSIQASGDRMAYGLLNLDRYCHVMPDGKFAVSEVGMPI